MSNDAKEAVLVITFILGMSSVLFALMASGLPANSDDDDDEPRDPRDDGDYDKVDSPPTEPCRMDCRECWAAKKCLG